MPFIYDPTSVWTTRARKALKRTNYAATRRKTLKNVGPTFPSGSGGSRQSRYPLMKGISYGMPHTGNFINPFPTRMNKIVTYKALHVLSAGSTGVFGSQQLYNINGLYDTDVTSAGHQPYGYDQLMTIYERYKVNACKVTFRLTDPTQDGLSFGYRFTNPGTSGSSIAGNTPMALSEQQNAGNINMNNSGSQKSTKVVFVKIWQIANLSKLQFKADPDNFTGSTSGNPGNLCQLQMAVADLRGGSSGSICVEITLDFYATFYQRKIFTQS